MFIILLKFSDNKQAAGEFMVGHKAWLEQGFTDGIFHVSGSIKPGLGGAILASSETREQLELRISEDPFVAEGVVSAEIIEVDANKSDQRSRFLLD